MCGACAPGRCSDKAEGYATREIACPMCNENGCPACDDTGYFDVPGCPQEQLDRELMEVIDLAEDIKRGNLPGAGGVLDQSKGIMSASKFDFAETGSVKAEAMKG